MASLAMPVLATSVTSPVVPKRHPDSPLTLTIDTDIVSLAQFACYYNGAPVAVKSKANQAQILFDQQLPLGRSRINCTAPSKADHRRFHWYSQPWFVPTPEGKYLD